MRWTTEDELKNELRALLKSLRTHGFAPSDGEAIQVAEMLVQIWRLAPELAQDLVEEALVRRSWPALSTCYHRLWAARLGKRGQIAVDVIWIRWCRLMQPDWRLPEDERQRHWKEALTLDRELRDWSNRVRDGKTPAEDLVKWACTIEPLLESWLAETPAGLPS